MLTDTAVRAARPRDKDYKLSDAGGLYLHVYKTGRKVWRFKFRVQGREQLLTFGGYPDVPLREARERRDEAKRALTQGIDPRQLLRGGEAAGGGTSTTDFETMAKRWWAIQQPKWTDRHAHDVLHSLQRDVFPEIGQMPISEITEKTILAVLRDVEARGAIETAKRLRQKIGGVFAFAIAEGECERNPAAGIGPALMPMKPRRSQPSITDLAELRALLIQVESMPMQPATKLANRLLGLTAVRPGTLIGARWSEFSSFDSEKPLWRIPASRMKMPKAEKYRSEKDHIVPLGPHHIAVLRALHVICGTSEYLFPSLWDIRKHMSENALGFMLKRAGFQDRHVPHGWRASFSTIMNEWAIKNGTPNDSRIIDLMLGHAPKDRVEAAYNRAQFDDRKRELALIWAEMLLDGLPAAHTLLEGPRK